MDTSNFTHVLAQLKVLRSPRSRYQMSDIFTDTSFDVELREPETEAPKTVYQKGLSITTCGSPERTVLGNEKLLYHKVYLMV